MRRPIVAGTPVLASMISSAAVLGAQQCLDDGLHSWNDTPARQAIIHFVRSVTTPGSPRFVPAAERIAVFDNDGTLWCEQPAYFQAMFAFDRIGAMAATQPALQQTEPFKTVLGKDAG